MPFRISSNRANLVQQPTNQADAQPAALQRAEPRARRWADALPPEPRPADPPSRRNRTPFGPSWQSQVEALRMVPAERAYALEGRSLSEAFHWESVHVMSRYREHHPIYLDERGSRNTRITVDSIVISGNGAIVSIPFAFPPRVRSLDLSWNGLTHLHSNLPSEIEVLKVDHNRLIELPNTLPRALRTLNARHNRLCALPDQLPANLQTLNLSHNHFVDLAPEDIDCLVRMAPSARVDLSFNPLSVQTIERLAQLQSSPGYQGPQIIVGTTALDLSWHNLRSVPNDLPPNLQVLNLACNPLRGSINNLPRDLLTLDLFGTGQSRLPDVFPTSLQALNFSHNQLVHISQANINALIRMGASAIVNLTYNPLSDEASERLDQLRNSPTYRGPRIILDDPPSPTARPAVPVVQPAAPARVDDPPEPASVAVQNLAPVVLSRLDAEVAAELLEIQRTATEAGHPIGDAEFINMALDQIQLNPAQADQRPARPAEPQRAEPRARRWADALPPEPRPTTVSIRRNWNPLGEPSWYSAVHEWAMQQPVAQDERSSLYRDIVLSHLNRDVPVPPLVVANRQTMTGMPRARRGWLDLYLSGRSIVSAPPAFPPRLFSLVLTHNRLAYLPSNLPSHLQWLDVRYNHLRDLPNTLPRELRALNANRNRLCALPDQLPANLQTLDLLYNHFVDLSPQDIDCLTRMSPTARVDLSFNPLSLQTIERLAQLQSSPGYRGPQIIVGTTALDLSHHNLSSVPNDLPPNLQILNLSYNPLRGPINNLPRDLRTLYLYRTGLSRLPDALPDDLQELDISGNPLRGPINNLPRHLRELDLKSTGLSSLPDVIPTSLQRLDFCNNQLVDISQANINTLTRMGPSGIVDLTGNPLSPEAIERVAQLANSPTYRGPRIIYYGRSSVLARATVPVAQPAAPARVNEQPEPASIAIQNEAQAVLSRLDPEVAAGLLQIQQEAAEAGHPIGDAEFINMALDQMQMNPSPIGQRPAAPSVRQPAPPAGLAAAVAAWRSEPPGDIAPNPLRWREFSAEPNATAFSDFLARLATTTNANNPQFRNKVNEWLHHLETNPQLRSDTFTVSEGANATCGDRIHHAFNDMRQLRLASDVSNGDYDQRLPELLTLARGMFRLGQLEDIARNHAASRPGVDEIEVYLGFQVMLRERLALPLDTANMLYPGMAEIRPEHLERAYNRVIVAERRGFADYLANDWRPWQAVLQRQIPVQYELAQERLIEAMDQEFSTRLQVRLQEVGLENDPDAQRTMGPLVQAEIAREINGPLTQDFLRSKGLRLSRHI